MQALPHVYHAQAKGGPAGAVAVGCAGASAIDTFPPPEFGGPQGQWSPEALLLAAVADCFVLTFRAVARAAGLQWDELAVQVEGVLERADGGMRFTRVKVCPSLLTDEEDRGKAHAALEKAEQGCLVTRSLSAEVTLEAEVTLRT